MYPIDFFWRAAQQWPDRVAIDHPRQSVTYAQLAQQVRAVAAGLVALDSTPQSRVGICAGNSAEHIVALLAVLACGKVWVPLNPKSTESEIRRITDTVTPSIVMVEVGYAAMVSEQQARRVWLGAAAGAPLCGPTVQALYTRHAQAPTPQIDLPLDATQAIKFTGGTTGVPKGVMQPYRAWMANIVNQIHAWEITEHDRYVMAAPITHGTSTYVLPILAQGGCHVIMEGAGAAAVRDTFAQRGGTLCFMPPTLVYMLMGLPGASRADYPQLRRLIYGGAPMPPEKVRAVRDFFGPVLGTTYGQTEAPQILTAMRPQDFEDEHNWAAVGRSTWFSDVAIMSPEGRLLQAGEVGEVVARGPLLMTGYWNLPDKTAQTLIDGWLHTGDRGMFDARGYLYLKDRLKDMVITGGFNVYPIDVENALTQHPAVHECAVFGIPDDKWGESVQAAVQLRPGQQASAAELLAFVRKRLGPVQTPKQIHFHDDLPRSPVGKVLKTAVREQALASARATQEPKTRRPAMSSQPQKTPTTSLCTHTLTSLTYGNANLVEDLMGKKSFTEVMLMQILGRTPRPVDLRITDVVLIVLMEHGLTPSAIATRLIYMSAPENLQGAVSAGLLAVGSSFVGTMENCSRLLDDILAAPDQAAKAQEIAARYKALKSPVPGFGHHLHKPVDPRAYKLLELGRNEPDLKGDRIRALEILSQAVDEAAGRPITINATGAVAALLGEIAVPTAVMRGFAVISRAAGLVAHIVEEQKDPSGRFIWDTIEHAIPYVSPDAKE